MSPDPAHGPQKRRLGLPCQGHHSVRARSPGPLQRLAGIGYVAVRTSIVNQQLASMRHQALANAVLLRGELRVPTAYIPALITTLDSGPNTDSLIYSTKQLVPSSATLSPRQLPRRSRYHVLGGLTGLAGHRVLWNCAASSVGVPIHAQSASRSENAALLRDLRTCQTSQEPCTHCWPLSARKP